MMNKRISNPQAQPSGPGDRGHLYAAAIAGALICGSSALAREARRSEMKNIKPRVVIKEAVGGGILTAAGAYVGHSMFHSGPLALAVAFVVGAGAKYYYDGLTAARSIGGDVSKALGPQNYTK